MKFFKLIFLGVGIFLMACGQNSAVDKTQEILASLTEEPVITEGSGATVSSFVAELKTLSNLMVNLQNLEEGENISEDQQVFLSTFSQVMSLKLTSLEDDLKKTIQGEEVILNYELDGDSTTTEQAQMTQETLSYLDSLFQPASDTITQTLMTKKIASGLQTMALFESSLFFNNLVTHHAASLKIWLDQAEAFLPGGMITAGGLCLTGNVVACSAFGTLAKMSEIIMIGKTAMMIFPTELNGISFKIESINGNKMIIRVVGSFSSSVDTEAVAGLALGKIAGDFVKTNLSDLFPTEAAQSIFTEALTGSAVSSLDVFGYDTSQQITLIDNSEFTIDSSYVEVRSAMFDQSSEFATSYHDYSINDDGTITINLERALPGELIWVEVSDWPTAEGETFISEPYEVPAQEVEDDEDNGGEEGSTTGSSTGESGSDGGEGDETGGGGSSADVEFRFYCYSGEQDFIIDDITIVNSVDCKYFAVQNLTPGQHSFALSVTDVVTSSSSDPGDGVPGYPFANCELATIGGIEIVSPNPYEGETYYSEVLGRYVTEVCSTSSETETKIASDMFDMCYTGAPAGGVMELEVINEGDGSDFTFTEIPSECIFDINDL